jgi:hypothetical protein
MLRACRFSLLLLGIGLVLGGTAVASELGEKLMNDFRAQLTDSQARQLQTEGLVEVVVSKLPREMVERAVELSRDLFVVWVNGKEKRPASADDVFGGSLALAKASVGDHILVETLVVTLTWRSAESEPTQTGEAYYTASGVYFPEPYDVPPVQH